MVCSEAISSRVLDFFQKMLAVLFLGSFVAHANAQHGPPECTRVFMVDQEVRGHDKIGVVLRGYDVEGPVLLEETLLYKLSTTYPDGAWLDHPIIDPLTMRVVFAEGGPYSVQSQATQLSSVDLAWKGGDLVLKGNASSWLFNSSSYRELTDAVVNWTSASITHNRVSASDDGTIYGIAFSVHSGLAPGYGPAKDTLRLGLLHAEKNLFRPLTLNSLDFNDNCPTFLPGLNDSMVFLSDYRKDCPYGVMCAYSMHWTNEWGGDFVGDDARHNVQRLFNTTGFVGDCPSFGKITWQGREAHALLFMENLGAFNHAVGYSVLQDGVFTPYQRLFNISKVNLELITAAQALVECTLSPWNTSGTWLGDIVCASAEYSLVIVDTSGRILQNFTYGNFGKDTPVYHLSRHPSFKAVDVPNCAPGDDLSFQV